MTAQLEQWLAQLPGDDPATVREAAVFSFDRWLADGRAIPNVAQELVDLLAAEDLAKPSPLAERAVYALGMLGDVTAVPAITRLLSTPDVVLKSEALAALGRLRASGELDRIAIYLKDPAQDRNVRGNACIALGNLGVPNATVLLAEAAQDTDTFVAACAKEGLRLLQGQT